MLFSSLEFLYLFLPLTIALYFAMPKEDKYVVGKSRLAAEEIFKMIEEQKKAKKEEAKAKAE